MKKHKIDHGTWIALCDGARSLILSNIGDEKFFNFRTVEATQGNRRHSHEMGNDKPPRVQESIGNRRSAIEPTDKHDEEERRFLREFADRLHIAVTTELTASLVLIAPPRALGYLRTTLSDAVRHAVRYEFDKDFLKLTIDDLEIQLKSLLSKQ